MKENPKANGNTSEETDNWIQSVNKLTYKGWFSDNILFTSTAYLQFQTGEYRFDLDNYMLKMCGDSTFNYGSIYDYGLTHYMYGNMSAIKFYIKDFTLTTGYNVYRYQRQYYMSDKYKSLNIVNIDPSEYYDNTGYKTDISAFVSGNYSLGYFEFNGNIQYRYVDFSYTDNMNPEVIYNKDTKWNFVNGGLGVDYNINSYHKIYGRWTLTHREPTRSDMFGGNEWYPGDITTNVAEIVNDFEVGYSVENKIVKAILNVYFMKFKNERVLNGELGINGLPQHTTADNSFRAGVEISSDVNITKTILWTFNGSLSRNKIKTFENTYNHILTTQWTINSEIIWHKNNIKIGVSEYWRSKMYIDTNNEFTVPDYFSLNVFGSYRIKNVEFGIRINNITNRLNIQYGVMNNIGNPLYFQESKLNAFGDIKVYF